MSLGRLEKDLSAVQVDTGIHSIICSNFANSGVKGIGVSFISSRTDSKFTSLIFQLYFAFQLSRNFPPEPHSPSDQDSSHFLEVIRLTSKTVPCP